MRRPLVVGLTDTWVQDGSVPPLRVGQVVELPLFLHRRPSVLAPPDAPDRYLPDPGADPSRQWVAGRTELVERHRYGGALVLVDERGAAYVAHLDVDDPAVAAGQSLSLLASVSIDWYAWLNGPGFPEPEDFPHPWRVARLQRRTAPLVPVPGEPGTHMADWTRADVAAVVETDRACTVGMGSAVDYIVTLEEP